MISMSGLCQSAPETESGTFATVQIQEGYLTGFIVTAFSEVTPHGQHSYLQVCSRATHHGVRLLAEYPVQLMEAARKQRSSF